MVRQATLTNAPAGATTGTPVAINPFRFVNVAIVWGSGCSAGAIAVKQAEHANDTSDWSTLATVNFSGARMSAALAAGKTSYQDVVEVTAPHGAVRADASGVAGGVVNATVQCWPFGG